MPWTSSESGTLPSLKNKSLEVREIFAKVANDALERGLSEEEAITAGISAVSRHERKKLQVSKVLLEEQKKAIKEKVETVPLHLSVILEAANNKRELEKQAKTPTDVRNEIINEVITLMGKTVVDMQVEGEEVVLIYSNGKRVRRKLADYNIESKIYTAVQSQLYIEPCSGINSNGEPELYFSSDGDVMTLLAPHLN